MEKALLLYWWQRFAGLRSLGKLGGPPRHTEATVRYTQGVRALMKTGGHAVSVQGGLWHQKDPGGHKAPEGKASRGGVAPRGQATCSSERQCGWSCVTAATMLRQGCEVADRRHVSGKFWNQNITGCPHTHRPPNQSSGWKPRRKPVSSCDASAAPPTEKA